MTRFWHRIIFLLLLIGLPLFGAASTSMSVCAPYQEMSRVAVDHHVESSNCALPCPTARGTACEVGNACGSSLSLLVDTPRLTHSLALLSVYQPVAVYYPASHIPELFERPPLAG